MCKKLFPLIFLLITGSIVVAQRPADLLQQWVSLSPLEKVYLHLDRDNYVAGDTAWFKAYLSSDYEPDTISTVLYLELWKDASTMLDRKIWPVLLGITNGQLSLGDSLTTGEYILRAYTATQLNHDASLLYQRSVYIQGKKDPAPPAVATGGADPHVFFFPEGGNLVAGLSQSVAFKITDMDGLPLSATGQLLERNGKPITAIGTYHDGMGVFTFTPEAGKQYDVVLEGNTNRKYPLPAVTLNGIGLSVLPHPQGFFFEVQPGPGGPAFVPAYMIGQMQHRVVIRNSFSAAAAGGLQGVIDTRDLHSGILQLTVFNKDDMPLAERLCFVNNKEWLMDARLQVDTFNNAPMARNRFTISMPDTVSGSFSISVTDADHDLLPVREENILTRLLLSADLPGFIHRPSWYFQAPEDSSVMALDLLMLTHGWRRFNWTSLLRDGIPAANYRDPGFIRLMGKAYLRDTKRPFSEGNLALMISGQYTRRITQLLTTDAEGIFRVDSLVFFDKCRLLFSDVRGKKSKYIDISLSADSLRRAFSLPSPVPYTGRLPWVPSSDQLEKMKENYQRILQASGKMMDEIRITAVRKSPLQQVDERYTRGMFSGDASRAIDLVNNSEAETYLNIFDYLQNRVNGLQIVNNGLDYGVFYRQGPTISSMGNIPMTIFLDEVETDVSVIAAIPASQIALVKVYNSFVGAVGNGAGGVLAIYTKKGGDITQSTGFANLSFYQGYSVVKEFYAPDYGKREHLPNGADNRVTLDWRPSVFVNHINPRIPVSFYNSEKTRRFRVVAEGMTTDGRLLMLEKLIDGQ